MQCSLRGGATSKLEISQHIIDQLHIFATSLKIVDYRSVRGGAETVEARGRACEHGCQAH
jgi:hypothetical protein